MNADEKEMLKVGAETAMKPFASLIEKLFGGAAEEIGGVWQDELAVRRQIRRIKLFQKLQAAIDEAGFEPRQIPDNIWIPAVTAALQQDDESMQDRWANLLATAADPGEQMIPPAFPSILSELSSAEVKLLDHIFGLYPEDSGHASDSVLPVLELDLQIISKFFLIDNASEKTSESYWTTCCGCAS